MEKFSNRFLWLFFTLIIGVSGLLRAQTPVALAAQPVFSSFLSNGSPNGFGCVFTYQVGSNTPLGTFADYLGTVANPNPVILSAGGTAQIFYQTNSIYRVIVKSFGGTNCASGTTLYTVDGIANFYGLLNLANSWVAQQTFLQPIVISPLDFQIVLGASGNQTTLDFPPPSGPITLTFPNSGQSILGNLSPSITTPIINGCSMTNGPATYACIGNSPSISTLLNGLAIILPFGGGASVATTASTGGVIGVVTANAGISGNATIQQSGPVNCLFDGATAGGDYAQISSTSVGNCHDTGASTYPTAGGQVIGKLINSCGSAGLCLVDLFSPEIQPQVASTANKQVIVTPFTNATTTPTAIPGLNAFSTIGTTLTLTCQLTWQGSAGTAGPKFSLAAPTTGTGSVTLNLTSAVTASTPFYGAAYAPLTSGTQSVGNSGTVTTSTNFPAIVTASVVAPAGFNIQLLAAANGAGTLTIEGGFCISQ